MLLRSAVTTSAAAPAPATSRARAKARRRRFFAVMGLDRTIDISPCRSNAADWRHWSLMAPVPQDFVGQTGFISKPRRGQRNLPRPCRAREALAGERIPHRFIEQAGRVAAVHHCVAEMAMVAM